jgi:hypothetical protein
LYKIAHFCFVFDFLAGNLPIQRGLGDLHWFANAPLNLNGSTALRVDFEDKQQSQSIEWVRWNALGASPLTLRLGDSVDNVPKVSQIHLRRL